MITGEALAMLVCSEGSWEITRNVWMKENEQKVES
jgi:hypothetical protein